MFEYFYAGLQNHIESLLRGALIFILWGIALRVTQRGIPHLRESLISRQTSGESGQRIRTLSRVMRYSLNVTATVVAGLLMLGEFGVSVAPLLGAAGVAGIAIGFGAQNLVKDYFTGFFLLLEDQIRIGDVVEAGGKGGLVEELTLRYLKLRDYSGNVHFVPNGNITTVTNMSMGFAYAVIDASIAYGEDIDQAISVMRRTGEEIRIDPAFANKFLAPLEIAGVESWASSAIVIRCRFKVTPLAQWDVRREYLRRLKQAFDKEGIEIPYPHMKVLMDQPDHVAS
ncbi:MAG: mechanosensitive ion channel family protein [Rugosibacter sp.]|nr:mechanosensitive ion channel family protein [Rugosibacter sp.]